MDTGRLYFKHLIFLGRRMPDKDDEVFQHFEKVTVIDSSPTNYQVNMAIK